MEKTRYWSLGDLYFPTRNFELCIGGDVKSTIFFEELTKNSIKTIVDDLDADLDNENGLPIIGKQFFAMEQSERAQIKPWMEFYEKLGVVLVVGDANGVTTELDEDFVEKINTIYGHFSIVGMRGKRDLMENRLRSRNQLEVDELCKEHAVIIKKRIKSANRNMKVIKRTIYALLALMAVSMGLAFHIEVLYSALMCLGFYLIILFLNKMLKKSVDIQLNSWKNFEYNKDLFWDNITQKNEQLIMEKLCQKMTG